MVLILSLCSALAYGLSDFVGGLLTRRASAWAVAVTSQAAATVLALGLLIASGGDPGSAALLWGMLAGIGSGVGNVCIYRIGRAQGIGLALAVTAVALIASG